MIEKYWPYNYPMKGMFRRKCHVCHIYGDGKEQMYRFPNPFGKYVHLECKKKLDSDGRRKRKKSKEKLKKEQRDKEFQWVQDECIGLICGVRDLRRLRRLRVKIKSYLRSKKKLSKENQK